MIIDQRLIFWALLLAPVILAFSYLSSILPPFIIGMAIAYMLDPLANWLESLGMRRSLAVFLILLGFLAVAVGLVFLLGPLITAQITSFIQALPDLASRLDDAASATSARFTQEIAPWLQEKFNIALPSAPSDLQGLGARFFSTISQWLAGFLNSLISGGSAILSVISIVFITPVVAFYMLLDWNRMIASIDSYVPRSKVGLVRRIAAEVDKSFSGFVRGQSLVCLFLATWYGIGLALIGVNHGLAIGAIGGILSFIPYAGSIFVLVCSITVAVMQSWPSIYLPLAALILVGVGQFIEGNILSPRLVGDSVGLHPVWIMFALFAFGSLFGFWGLLVAVPVAAAIGVLIRFVLTYYRTTDLYLGRGPTTRA